MTRHRFTTRFIDSLKPPQTGRVEYWDKGTPGFGLRISESGRKTWVLMYRPRGSKVVRRLTIGTIDGGMKLGKARDEAKDALRAAAKGLDPAATKKAERRAETFREVAGEFIERYAKREKRSWRKDQVRLDRDILPAIGNRKAKDVQRRDVIKLLDGIVARGAPVEANRVHSLVRRIFNWAISRDLVAVNPAAGIERPGGEEAGRDRVLTDDEIKAVWAALEDDPKRVRCAFRLLLATAQRPGEVSKMRPKDIEGDWWTIPAEFSKNGKPHRVYLSKQARTILEDCDLKGDWVFPSDRTDSARTDIWKAIDGIRERSGVDFRSHDLRRTAGTNMTRELGITRSLLGKVLNHTGRERGEAAATRVYDRYEYDREKQEALTAWGSLLDEILARKRGRGKVVPLRKV